MGKELENSLLWQATMDEAYARIKELEEENRKLKEERDFFKEQAILWRNDYKNEYEENKKLKENSLLWQATMDEAYARIKELEERIRFLEQCLDNKEKVNKSLREEIKELNKMMLFETELEK